MSVLLDVSQTVEEFCNVSFSTTEQHVDARSSRIARDNCDIQKLSDWLYAHPPFPLTEEIMSISTGLIGDEKINCHTALEMGKSAMTTITGTTFKDIKFQRKTRVTPLRALTTSIKVRQEVIPIDPTTLFQRISLAKKTDAQLRNYFNYELAPYPRSLFDECGMRKTQKSKFYESFSPLTNTPLFEDHIHVVDGGFLLHRVVWHQNETFEKIATQYIQYVKKYYEPNSVIVFDGYPEDVALKNTKSAERLRRIARQVAPEIAFDDTMKVTISQDKFLSNEKNKSRLIPKLTAKLEAAGFIVRQASEDADALLINTAIEWSTKYKSVIVVGEDIDLLVLLAELAPTNSNIYFLKPSRAKTDERLYSSSSFKFPLIRHFVAFLHAFSGCDTTCAFFRQGKGKLVKLVNKEKDLRSILQIFNEPDSHPDFIDLAGQKLIIVLYGAKAKDHFYLDEFRYLCFVKSASRTSFDLSILPPTQEAARQHSLRVYYQLQQWRGRTMDPQEWGWRKTKNGLMPIPTKKDPLPEELLKSISCKCAKGCNTNCSCKKSGLRCSIVCTNCRGKSCANVEAMCIADEVNEEEQPIEPMSENDNYERDDDISYSIEINKKKRRRRRRRRHRRRR